MKRLRLAAVLTGLGALVACPVVRAAALPEPSVDDASATSAPAMALLQSAAKASRAKPWSGTERVETVSAGRPVVTLEPVSHGLGEPQPADDQLFGLLTTNYDLTVGPATVCAGRSARVVEVRRPWATGAAAVAGRYWLDVASGLVLRRDVLDEQGGLLRRVELTELHLGPGQAASTAIPQPRGERLDALSLAAMQAQGWPAPVALPGGMERYDARWLDGEVLQLAYSDGLSTLSLFVQSGVVTPHGTGVVRRVGGGSVWEAPGAPERVVWSSRGFTWTLVSEADPAQVEQVLLSLPHDARSVAQDGLVPRVWRGMSRVGAWLNPFE